MTDSVDRPAVTRDYHFAQVPEWVLYHPDLSAQAVRVFGALDRHAGEAGSCYPSLARIARLIGCSQDTVRRAIADLVDAGAVVVTPQFVPAVGHDGEPTGKMRQTSNTYELRGAPPGAAATPPPSPNATAAPRGDAGPITRASVNESQEERTTRAPLVDVSDETLASATSETFDATWALYPRKLNRKGAEKAWLAQLRKGVDPGDLYRAVENYARLRAGKDPTTTMHGSTFFGPNDRWADYVDGIPHDEVALPDRRRESERQRKQRRAVEEMQRHAANRQELPA